MKRIFGAVLIVLIFFAGMGLFFAGTIFVLPIVNLSTYKAEITKDLSDSLSNPEKEKDRLKKNIADLNKKIDKLTPGSAFIIINTSDNSFRLFKENRLIRSGMCSTGSFKELIVSSKKSYLFETPKGALTVKNKKKDPVWAKPDWAFIEEGLPVPPPGHSSRFEKYVLGAYALELGDGYMLHGTIYQRFLGLPVTHGCVRLGDDDLEIIYQTLQVGSRVFIL